MRAWRLCKAKWADNFDGMGAAIEGGRWNAQDVPAIYLGLDSSTCVLETFVHQSGPPLVAMVMVEVELPDDAGLYVRPALSDLPAGWDNLPADAPSRQYGTDFLQRSGKFGLIIPSVVNPLARNIVLTPNHRARFDIQVRSSQAFVYDARMFSMRGVH
jgi:RES domain-containing protein